jgi:hypothetical protein
MVRPNAAFGELNAQGSEGTELFLFPGSRLPSEQIIDR